MGIKLLQLALILCSCLSEACVPCVENFEESKLIAYSEPQWTEIEVPLDKKGKVTAIFDLTEAGKPINVRIIEIIPASLSESKLKSSIQFAIFSPESIDCGRKGREINKGVKHTFELSFEKVFRFK